MSEAVRTRRRRRRRRERSVWGEPSSRTRGSVNRDYARSRRRLAWGMALAFGLAALLFACILSPSGVGVGTIQPVFSRSQGTLVVANGNDYAWEAVAIRPNLLWSGEVDDAPRLDPGATRSVLVPGGAVLGFDLPVVVLLTCDKPREGRSGLWVGLA